MSAGTLMPPAFPYAFLFSFSELRFCSLPMKRLFPDKCTFCLEIKLKRTFLSDVLLIPRGHLCFLLPPLCILFICAQFSKYHMGVISFICPTSLNYKSKTHVLSIQVIILWICSMTVTQSRLNVLLKAWVGE